MGKLSIVGTPIGNLEDITLRALRVLKEADLILCEDTRVTSKLLAKYEISKPLKRFDAIVEHSKSDEILDLLGEGKNIALVTDAGTPAISDPGSHLVSLARARGVNIEAIAGPSSLTAALSIAGVPTDDFLFLGFLPHKKGRSTALSEVIESERAVVLFESPHRILKLLGEISERDPLRRVTTVREITKMFESVETGTAQEVSDALNKAKAERGEFVVITHPLS